MDSLTHIALGACIGEAFAGKRLGKRAMLWGALAQTIPDIDFVASFWMDTPSSLLAHRGFTHSILFCAMITPVFAMVAERLHRPKNFKLSSLMLFFVVAIFSHILIDAFNSYGVGWFEPFNHYRISFNAVYVADPFFSFWPGIASVALIIVKESLPQRKKWWLTGLGMSALYLIVCLFIKFKIDAGLSDIVVKQQLEHKRYFTTPAPFQNLLWYVVVGNDSGYEVGFRSILDSKKQIDFQYFPRNDSLVKQMGNREEVQQLIRFSQQFFTIEKRGDTIVFNDLRFGQIHGWENPRGPFVFHYLLQYDLNSNLVVQRGRLQGWDHSTIKAYLKRIEGN
ncbi:MAG: metal-dependent hydrolase [Bacteroidetes bacterium]|nr:metal-dependent hydrolase [Bacteroidota bacterium]